MTTPTTPALVAELRAAGWHLRSAAPVREIDGQRKAVKTAVLAAADAITALEARIGELEAALARVRTDTAAVVEEALTK
jgi:hypothetical protein